MKRLLSSALALSAFSMIALVGCEDTSTSKTKTEVSTPDGKTTVEDKKTIKESGSNPPAVESGKTTEAPK